MKQNQPARFHRLVGERVSLNRFLRTRGSGRISTDQAIQSHRLLGKPFTALDIAQKAHRNRVDDRIADSLARVEERWRAWRHDPTAENRAAYEDRVDALYEAEVAYYAARGHSDEEAREIASRSAVRAKRRLTKILAD